MTHLSLVRGAAARNLRGPLLLSGITLGVLCSARPAHAELDPAFAPLVTVDTEWVSGANNATDVAFASGDRALITRKTGQIVVRQADGNVTVIDYPFGGTLDTASEKGLLGVVADPNTPDAFYFYVSNGPTDDKHRVYRAVLNEDDTLTVDPAPVIGADAGNGPGLEGPANHDGGGLFIHDGFLFVSVGDTGANATPPVNKYSSCLNKGNGKILRVGLDGSVPDDNPLVALDEVTACDDTGGDWTTAAPDPRVYAWGMRNPFRFWIDAETGLLWIGDVGETTREEISVGGGDQHYGYPFNEGDQNWREMSDLDGNNDCMDIVPGRPCTPSAYAYDRGDSDDAAVTGGLIPEGCGWSNVFPEGPVYLFGDSSLSWIQGLPVNAGRDGVSSQDPIDFATYDNARPVAFRMGPDQSLYVVFHGAGAVYRFTPTDLTGADCEPDPMGTAGGGGVGAGGGTAGGGGTPAGGAGTGGAGTAGGGTAGGGGTPSAGGVGAGGVPGSAGAGAGGSPAAGGNGMVPNPDTPAPTANPPGTPTTTPNVPAPNPTGGNPQPTPGPTPSGSNNGGGGAGGASVGDDAATDDGGCGCRVVGQQDRHSGPVAGLLLALAALLFSRRRREQ
jgi:MYXO-CTERM domain-containing protein